MSGLTSFGCATGNYCATCAARAAPRQVHPAVAPSAAPRGAADEDHAGQRDDAKGEARAGSDPQCESGSRPRDKRRQQQPQVRALAAAIAVEESARTRAAFTNDLGDRRTAQLGRGLDGRRHSRTSGRSRAKTASPIPLTSLSSSTLVNRPFAARQSRMR
jgi:hypothetical protein